MSKKKSILYKAYKIVDERSEERSRNYGDFSECMIRTAKMASVMTGKQLRAHDVFYCLIALKLSRESFKHKADNMIDAAGYIGGLNNYFEEELAKTKLKKYDRKRKS